MKNTMKNTTKYTRYVRLGIESAVIGIAVGFLISLVFSALNGASTYYPSAPAFVSRFGTPLKATVASAAIWVLIGLVFGYGSLIFEIEKWSLLKRTVINCCVYYVSFLPLAIVAGWFPLDGAHLAVFTGIYLLIYAIFWAVNYWIAEAEIHQINQCLKERADDSDNGDSDNSENSVNSDESENSDDSEDSASSENSSLSNER